MNWKRRKVALKFCTYNNAVESSCCTISHERELKMKLVEKSLKRWRRGKLPLCIAIALCRIAELHESEKKSNKVLLTLIIILLLHCMTLSLFLSYKIGWGSKREEENCSVNNCPEEYEWESAQRSILYLRRELVAKSCCYIA